ncbi:MAG TPA: hypothetical protein VGO39_04215 [Gaiellaceae bacterium]|nr:hypothetical protein [Gaiellaceae bacterium]
MFRRAIREIRVIGGLLLLVAGVGAGLYELQRVTGQADRDFALCGGVQQAPGCVSKRRPVSVSWAISSDNGFRREYEVAVRTRPNVTVSLFGMTRADVAPFEGLETTEIRYRQGRLVAIVAPDGTSLEVPFSFSRELLIVLGAAALAVLLGMGSLAWGLTRVNRTPRA